MLLLDGLTFGAGLFALWLFYRRNRSFEKQVDTGQKQAETAEKNLFNDRLSRGIEALGHKKIAVRNSGLRLLYNLGNDAEDYSEELKLIIAIIHGYIRDRAMMPQKNERGELPGANPREERVDIELAIEILFEFVPLEERFDVPLNNLDLRNLDFSEYDLQSADLYFSNMMGSSLFNTNLSGSFLMGAILESSEDYRTELSNTDFSSANLTFCNLKNSSVYFCNLTRAKLANIEASNAKITKSNLYKASFKPELFRYGIGESIRYPAYSFMEHPSFSYRGKKVQSTHILKLPDFEGADFEENDISDVIFDVGLNITEENFFLTEDQLSKCIYENQKPPLGLLQGLELPADRAYEWVENENGQMCRSFVHDGKWIDMSTPLWFEGNEDA